MPYTGVFSEYGAIGRAEAAYFRMVNDRGGVTSRKINFVSMDFGTDVAQIQALSEPVEKRPHCCYAKRRNEFSMVVREHRRLTAVGGSS